MQHIEIFSGDHPLTLNSNSLPVPSASYRADFRYFEDIIDDSEGTVDDNAQKSRGEGASPHASSMYDGDDLDSSEEEHQFDAFSMSEKHKSVNSNPYHAFVYEVEISFYYGRTSTILELYVPKLECSFNDCAGFCQQAGNVIQGYRGWNIIEKVLLTKEQFNTLQTWRDIEFNYRKEISAVREKALNTCFGSSLKTVQRASSRSQMIWLGENFSINIKAILKAQAEARAAKKAADSLLRRRTSENEREIFYRYAGIRSKDFIVQSLIENSQKLYTSALKLQLNIKILYRKWKIVQMRDMESDSKKEGGK